MFQDPERVARYSDGPKNFVPGFVDIHKMAHILIQEVVGAKAHVLVHGAGGGLELEAFARANPEWHFTGVDPAKPMLEAAEKRLGKLAQRVALVHGFIDDAPDGPYDAATSLLTLHFLDLEARLKTVSEIVRRLKPGAPFIAAHSSFPRNTKDRHKCLSHYRDFAITNGVEPNMAQQAMESVSTMLPAVTPHEDVEILQRAGLKNVCQFYQGFNWFGWVGYA